MIAIKLNHKTYEVILRFLLFFAIDCSIKRVQNDSLNVDVVFVNANCARWCVDVVSVDVSKQCFVSRVACSAQIKSFVCLFFGDGLVAWGACGDEASILDLVEFEWSDGGAAVGDGDV